MVTSVGNANKIIIPINGMMHAFIWLELTHRTVIHCVSLYSILSPSIYGNPKINCNKINVTLLACSWHLVIVPKYLYHVYKLISCTFDVLQTLLRQTQLCHSQLYYLAYTDEYSYGASVLASHRFNIVSWLYHIFITVHKLATWVAEYG